MIDGAHDIYAVASYGPILLADEETGILISLDLLAGRLIWWHLFKDGTKFDRWYQETYRRVPEALPPFGLRLRAEALLWYESVFPSRGV